MNLQVLYSITKWTTPEREENLDVELWTIT